MYIVTSLTIERARCRVLRVLLTFDVAPSMT